MKPEKKEEDGRRRAFGISGGVAALSYLAIAALLALVLVLVLRARRRDGFEPAAEGAAAVAAEDAGEEALSRPAEGWLELAEQRLVAGDFAGAVRALYLALLVRLHREGRLEVRRAQTNWELFRRLARAVPGASGSFRELTQLFDRVVYGKRAVGPEDYGQARRLADAVLAAAEAAATATAAAATAASAAPEPQP
jgi:hypothetical protein